MEFKEKLIILRKEKSLSQEGLAEIIGISRQAVAKWELGQGFPDIDNLIRLSNLFKISIDRLVKEEECSYFLSGNRKNPDNIDAVIYILLKAKRATYAGKGPEAKASRPSSHDFSYCEEDFEYIDTYVGGEKFAGDETVWYQGTPIWSMNYMGRLLGGEFSGDFLKEALLLGTEELPYRGPKLYRNGDYIYTSNVNGDFDWFQGYEEIFCQSIKVYECYFHGGVLK